MSTVVIPQSRPTIGLEESRAVDDVLASGYLAMGPIVSTLEEEFREYIGVRHSLAVNSGTSALHLALLALGVKAGSEVIIPSYTCTALLNAIKYIGASPVIADIDPATFCLSAINTYQKITPRTAAIIVVHTFGIAADMNSICSFGIPVVEDCAHSLGGYIKDQRMGSIGDAAVFSFYTTKMMTTGEGGMLVTRSDKLADFARNLRSYDNPDNYEVRYNYKMSDISAAIGRVQLSKLDSFIEKRRWIAKRYDSFFINRENITLVNRNQKTDVYYRYIILMPDKKKAEYFMNNVRKCGIICDTPVASPLHNYLKLHDNGFPVTMEVFNRCVSIPIYPTLTDEEIDRIFNICRALL